MVQTVLISTRYLIPVVQLAPLHMLCTYEQGTSYYPLRYSRMPNSCGCIDVPRGQGLDGPRGHRHNESRLPFYLERRRYTISSYAEFVFASLSVSGSHEYPEATSHPSDSYLTVSYTQLTLPTILLV